MTPAKVSALSFDRPQAASPPVRSAAAGKIQAAFGTVMDGELAKTNAIKVSPSSNPKDPFVQLEAVFLRNFVEAMLPADNSGMFATGSAGEYWRSILADQMAASIALSGNTGIANILRGRFNK